MMMAIINIFILIFWMGTFWISFKAIKNFNKEVNELMVKVEALELQQRIEREALEVHHKWFVEMIKNTRER